MPTTKRPALASFGERVDPPWLSGAYCRSRPSTYHSGDRKDRIGIVAPTGQMGQDQKTTQWDHCWACKMPLSPIPAAFTYNPHVQERKGTFRPGRYAERPKYCTYLSARNKPVLDSYLLTQAPIVVQQVQARYHWVWRLACVRGSLCTCICMHNSQGCQLCGLLDPSTPLCSEKKTTACSVPFLARLISQVSGSHSSVHMLPAVPSMWKWVGLGLGPGHRR